MPGADESITFIWKAGFPSASVTCWPVKASRTGNALTLSISTWSPKTTSRPSRSWRRPSR